MVKAIIIGSGIAGLATAIRLARQGMDVEVYESAARAGGKISERRFDGFRFDTGPSLLTIPSLLAELLDDDLHISVRKLEIITRYFYEDTTRLTAYSDGWKLSKELAQKLQVSPERVIRYLRRAATVYSLTADLFIFGSFHRKRNLLNFKSLRTLWNFRKLHAFFTLHDFNHRELGDKRLVQLFDRYATYNGSNPYQSPATLSVISHLEHSMGAYIPKKGMYALIDILMQQSARLGINFHFNEPVLRVECQDGNVKGIWTHQGFMPADIVVSDIDIHRFYSTLLPDARRLVRIAKEERSSSALIFYWGIKGTFAELDVHNIFFSADYKQEFDYLFVKKEVYEDPTVYVYISSKYQENDAPVGCENWFVMVNAPADVGQNWQQIIEHTRAQVLRKLERVLGKAIQSEIIGEQVLSPPDIESQTGSVNGSLYGSSSNSRYATFNRHANFRRDMKGLYFVGGSVHPGGGIPLCLSSARIVGEMVKEQFQKAKE